MLLGVAGGGYVGLATATGFSEQGHEVHIFEIDSDRVFKLRSGEIPFDDASMQEPFCQGILEGRIIVHEGYSLEPHKRLDFAFICVPSPQSPDGSLDTTTVIEASHSIVAMGAPRQGLVIRSTVNPGTALSLEHQLASKGVSVLMNPEFLQEGSALQDFEHPRRVIIGATDRRKAELLAGLFAFADAPVHLTDPTTAETVKLAVNACLALRVSMTNEVARFAMGVGADVESVLEGVGTDPRIGPHYLKPGIGFGGSCLPKDLSAFTASARAAGEQALVFESALASNRVGVERICRAVRHGLKRTARRQVCIVGMAFKPNSDSVRRSLSVDLAIALQQHGIDVVAYDPKARANAYGVLKDSIAYADDLDRDIEECEIVVVVEPSLAEGSEFRGKLVIDSLGQVVSDVLYQEARPADRIVLPFGAPYVADVEVIGG